MDAFMLHGLLSGSDKRKHQTHHNLMKSHRSRSIGERRGIITNVPVMARHHMTPTGELLLAALCNKYRSIFRLILH